MYLNVAIFKCGFLSENPINFLMNTYRTLIYNFFWFTIFNLCYSLELRGDVAEAILPHVASGMNVVQTEVVNLKNKVDSICDENVCLSCLYAVSYITQRWWCVTCEQ